MSHHSSFLHHVRMCLSIQVSLDTSLAKSRPSLRRSVRGVCEKGAPTAPHKSPRKFPHKSPRNSPCNAPRNAPCNAPRNSPHKSPRNSPRGASIKSLAQVSRTSLSHKSLGSLPPPPIQAGVSFGRCSFVLHLSPRKRHEVTLRLLPQVKNARPKSSVQVSDVPGRNRHVS